MGRMRFTGALAASVMAVAALTACGGSSSTGSDTAAAASQTTPAPEEQTTTAAAVATGLATLKDVSSQIVASAADATKAGDLVEQLEPAWQPIEGTVKANDSSTYLAIEDAFALLEDAAKSGDATKASQGADGLKAAVDGYLAKYPG